MKTIIITGSVGSGKTTLAKKLCRKTGFLYGDANGIIARHKLDKKYDRKRKCFVVDERRLAAALLAEISSAKKRKTGRMVKGIIFDSHMAQCLPNKAVALCIVTKCGIGVLAKRLKLRGYSKEKIRENVQCEIFDVCYQEALAKKYKMAVVETTKGIKTAAVSRLAKIC